MTFKTRQILVFLLSLLFLNSCVRYPQLLEFRKTEEFTQNQNHQITNHQRILIAPDDILFIQVSALDPISVAPFNLMPTGTTMSITEGDASLYGYLVDANGFIDFPVLGKLNMAGLTTDEVKKVIVDSVANYVINPVVTVRFVNFKITVLGYVMAPGPISIQGERVTILEVIAMAGDFSPYAYKDRVQITREENGERIFGTIDLRAPDLYQSPFFYLQQNDVIYVEPVKEATAAVRDPLTEALPIFSAFISLTALVIAIVGASK